LGRILAQRQVKTVEVIIRDGRSMSPKQRKKICAICDDIARYQSDVPMYVRPLLTSMFCDDSDIDLFTLSRRTKKIELPDGSKVTVDPCDMTTAREFIDWLINFCFYWRVPTSDSLLNLCDDVGRYLYLCLEHRKCAICNKPAQVHHVDRIGIGRDREEIVHVGLLAIALCADHHDEAHHREKDLFAENHIYGIEMDEYLCGRLRLNTKERKG